MKFTYKTATATLVQFIALGLLNLVNGLDSIVTTCHHPGGDCVGNILSSVIFYIFITGWFCLIVVLGFLAQERRGKRLAQLLIVAEASVVLVALFNIKLSLRYFSGVLSLATSLVDIALAIWIITLAYRLMKADGRRITPKSRARRRTMSSSE